MVVRGARCSALCLRLVADVGVATHGGLLCTVTDTVAEQINSRLIGYRIAELVLADRVWLPQSTGSGSVTLSIGLTTRLQRLCTFGEDIDSCWDQVAAVSTTAGFAQTALVLWVGVTAEVSALTWLILACQNDVPQLDDLR